MKYTRHYGNTARPYRSHCCYARKYGYRSHPVISALEPSGGGSSMVSQPSTRPNGFSPSGFSAPGFSLFDSQADAPASKAGSAEFPEAFSPR